jgi:hypothetical protein
MDKPGRATGNRRHVMPATLTPESPVVLEDGIGFGGEAITAGPIERKLLSIALAGPRATADVAREVWPGILWVLMVSRLRNTAHRINAKLGAVGCRCRVSVTSRVVRLETGPAG